MALLEINQLSVDIPTPTGVARILKSVDFTMNKGDTLGLVGESGCGKSMTALAIMGLLPDIAQVSGEVLLDGENLLELNDKQLCKVRGRRIGMVFQEPMTALNPVKSIGFQIAEGMRLHLGLSRGEAHQRALRLLDRVGLPAPRFSPDLYPHQLSGGQRQRVVIAMTMACEPNVLIADEPTTALDVTIQARILDLIAELVDEAGMALIMITHDLGVVAQTTDRLAVMYAGSMIEAGSTRAVFSAMAHPYTRGLFAAIPNPTGTNASADGMLSTIPGAVPLPTDPIAGCAFAGRCERADAACGNTAPPLTNIADQHLCACFHPHSMTEPDR